MQYLESSMNIVNWLKLNGEHNSETDIKTEQKYE